MREQLDSLVHDMYLRGIGYREALRQFQKAFVLTVLEDKRLNQVRTAKVLCMHRNSLNRLIRELDIDIDLLRVSRRRPSRTVHRLLSRSKAKSA